MNSYNYLVFLLIINILDLYDSKFFSEKKNQESVINKNVISKFLLIWYIETKYLVENCKLMPMDF